MVERITSNAAGFQNCLSHIVKNSSFSWPFSHGYFFEYLTQSHKESGLGIIDNSCLWTLMNTPMVALMLTEISDETTGSLLSFGEVGATIIVNQNFNKSEGANSLRSSVNKYIDSLVSHKNVQLWFTDFLVDGKCNFLTNFLLKKEAIATTEILSVIELGHSEAKIKSNIRKSFRPCISWGQRNFNILLFDQGNISSERCEVFRKLHEAVSGRATRSIESWRLRLQMIREGKAFMVSTEDAGEIISCSFFISDGASVYYMASASKRDKFEKPVMHSALWSAIQHARNKGFKNFILGEIFPKSFGALKKKKKENNISKFKSGFGGELKPILQIKSNI